MPEQVKQESRQNFAGQKQGFLRQLAVKGLAAGAEAQLFPPQALAQVALDKIKATAESLTGFWNWNLLQELEENFLEAQQNLQKRESKTF